MDYIIPAHIFAVGDERGTLGEDVQGRDVEKVCSDPAMAAAHDMTWLPRATTWYTAPGY